MFPHVTHTNTALGHLPVILFCIKSHQRASTGCHPYTHAQREREGGGGGERGRVCKLEKNPGHSFSLQVKQKS